MRDLIDLIIEWIVDAIRGGKLTPEQRTRLVAACSALPVPGPAEGALEHGEKLAQSLAVVQAAIEADTLQGPARDRLLDSLLMIRPGILYRESGPEILP